MHKRTAEHGQKSGETEIIVGSLGARMIVARVSPYGVPFYFLAALVYKGYQTGEGMHGRIEEEHDTQESNETEPVI